MTNAKLIYEFTYFDPASPKEDKTWKSKSLSYIKKKREEIVFGVWQDAPHSVPITARTKSGRSVFLKRFD